MPRQVAAFQVTLSPYEHNLLLISLNSLKKERLAASVMRTKLNTSPCRTCVPAYSTKQEMKELLEHSEKSMGVLCREQWRESIAERRKADRAQQFCMQRNCSLLNELWTSTQRKRNRSTMAISNWWTELFFSQEGIEMNNAMET
uniref:Uncharacterized protein n=1 Tax=Glossina austeni TaxID=7395 RepID=A0A1A9VCV3_GLOAU